MAGGEGDVLVEGDGLLVAVDGELEGGAALGCERLDGHIDSRLGLGSHRYIRNSQLGSLTWIFCRGVCRSFGIKGNVELSGNILSCGERNTAERKRFFRRVRDNDFDYRREMLHLNRRDIRGLDSFCYTVKRIVGTTDMGHIVIPHLSLRCIGT